MFNQGKKNDNYLKKLYLDKDRKNFIKCQIDNRTTTDSIINKYHDLLINKIDSLNKLNIKDYSFVIIETRANAKKDDIPTLMEFKVNKKTKLFNLLRNPQYNLYFLPKQKSNLSDRKQARDSSKRLNNIYDEVEIDYFSATEEYLTKANFYLYDIKKQIFTKEKGSVDKNKITIFKNGNRETIKIFIKEIIKDLYYSDISPAPYRKNLPIKGDRPKFYIEIQTHKATYFFAQFKENMHLQWENAIKLAITEYRNFNVELNLDIKISTSKTSLFAIHHANVDSCFSINKILFNEEKRKYFFSCFQDKKIGYIVINILMYRELLKKEQYFDAWMRFKEILIYIESLNTSEKRENKDENKNLIIIEEDKLSNIFTQERIKKYKEISEIADEKVKNVKIEDSSLLLFQSGINMALNEVLKEDLFDDIFYYLYKVYIMPSFVNFKNILAEGSIPTEKHLIRQKFQFLLAKYFNDINNMNANNYYILSSKKNENEQINSKTESVNNQIMQQNI